MNTTPRVLSNLIVAGLLLPGIGLLLNANATGAEAARPNLLIVNVDDMSADSVGAFGAELQHTTPHIDRLATQGMRFQLAHVQVGNCMPSRNVMWSGRYPHNNRVEGFYQVRDVEYPVLCDLMKDAGYFTAIRGKVSHSTPYQPYAWDLVLDTLPDGSRAPMKDPKSYGTSTRQGIEAARKAGKPFCVMINISDPHKPFYGNTRGKGPDPYKPSRLFTEDEVPVPGFLFDDPAVRKELVDYYNSVRRADDCVGEVLSALEAAGEAENTFVLFFSDHGMPLPFAKTQLYHHSTRTPLIVRWPGKVSPGSTDSSHMVSAVDFLPTLLDVTSASHPEGLEGRSFVDLLRGESQTDRDRVFKEYNENAGGSREPMRGVQTKRFLYLFNPWSNGERRMATATTGTATYRRMVQLAPRNPEIARRLDLFQHRVVEELYDVESDPDCVRNLVDDPEYADALRDLRQSLERWMVKTEDPMLTVFRQRDDPEAREAYIQREEKEALARKMRQRKPNTTRKMLDVLQLEVPKAPKAGSPLTVVVKHTLPDNLGQQQLHVTLKEGLQGTRLERKVVTIKADGTAEIVFQVPDAVAQNTLRIAAFVGPEYGKHFQHVQSDAVRLAE